MLDCVTQHETQQSSLSNLRVIGIPLNEATISFCCLTMQFYHCRLMIPNETPPKNTRKKTYALRSRIHKTGNRGHPVVSSNSHPTVRISQLVDYHINPLITSLDSHILDTTDFLNNLCNLGNLPNDAVLVTLDVSSLYATL